MEMKIQLSFTKFSPLIKEKVKYPKLEIEMGSSRSQMAHLLMLFSTMSKPFIMKRISLLCRYRTLIGMPSIHTSEESLCPLQESGDKASYKLRWKWKSSRTR